MIDGYGRNIDYLRVSVTDRCNLRCKYCMPEEGIGDLGHTRILTLEQVHRLIQVAAGVGFKKCALQVVSLWYAKIWLSLFVIRPI